MAALKTRLAECGKVPNNRLQATAKSVRSSLAPALRRA
jgi:hypothetical protein